MKHALTTLLALLLALGLLCVSGCGDESAPKTSNTTVEAAGGDAALQPAAPKKQKLYLAFGGGPTGGTFNFFANKISSIVTHDQDHLDISPKGSAGSAENLRSLHLSSVDFSIVYAGDAFLGREGGLQGDSNIYDGVRAMAYLYGAPAQLVVRAESGIASPLQLKGKVVAVGNAGSGAALSAQRYFTRLGIWDAMDHRFSGYSQAAADFADGKIDAFWIMAGFPSSAIVEASSRAAIRLVPLEEAGKAAGFYDAMPFYTPTVIPAWTYPGQDKAVATFQDSALLCASKNTSAEAVHDTLSSIFSKDGLTGMVSAHRAAREMSVENGIQGISIPLHPGAATFWEERGLTIPAQLK